jgi:putative acetyltransferase
MIAGFADLEPDGHIDMLYVHAEHQSKGVARALLAHIEDVAIRLGLDRLYTEASITARTAFEHSGFPVVATQTVLLRGETFTNYRMERQIRQPKRPAFGAFQPLFRKDVTYPSAYSIANNSARS